MEDLFVQVDVLDEVFVLLGLVEIRELDVYSIVVFEYVVVLVEECCEFFDINVFIYFELGDFVEFLFGNVMVVYVENVVLFFGDVGGVESIGSVGSIFFGDSNIGNFGIVVEGSEFGQSILVVVNVKYGFVFFELKFFVNDGYFVVLQFFEGFFMGWVGDNIGSVDYMWVEELGVVVVIVVVVGVDLVYVLFMVVYQDVMGEGFLEEFYEGLGEGEGFLVMVVFEDIKNIIVEVDIIVDVYVREVLERDFVVIRVFVFEFFGFEGDVGFNWVVWKFCFVINVRVYVRCESLVSYDGWDKEDKFKEDFGFLVIIDGVVNELRYNGEKVEEDIVVEVQVVWVFSRERSIFDGRVLE